MNIYVERRIDGRYGEAVAAGVFCLTLFLRVVMIHPTAAPRVVHNSTTMPAINALYSLLLLIILSAVINKSPRPFRGEVWTDAIS